ncbi:MAG: cellulase family glycosylhydrolase [Terrimicrobiaceae bacterium]
MTVRSHCFRNLLIAVWGILAWTGLHAGTFHVSPDGSDAGAGGEKNPWQTIPHALDRLNPGDTVVVHPGKYSTPLQVRRSGTRRSRITIQAIKGARIEGGQGVPAITISGASWTTWEGFSIQGEILVSGSPEGLVVRANTLRGEGTGTGIHLANTRGAVIERNMVTGFEQGIVVAGVGNIVRNNIVRGNTRAGIVLGSIHSAQGTLVRNNTLEGNGVSADSAGGLWIRHAFRSAIENNILVSGPGRRLLTLEGDDGGNRFQTNLFFSPNGREGALICRAGKPEAGFLKILLATRDAGAVFADPAFSNAPATLDRSSPAIDISPLKPSPGEKDFSGKPRKSGFGIDLGADEFDRPPGLRREGNQLFHQGRPVRLRGVGMGDPLLDRLDQPLSQYELLREKWNANVVRISLHSYVWRHADLFGGRSAVMERLRSEIEAATNAGLFVILDWHITGWPDGFARLSDPGELPGLHDSNFALACDFWEEAARNFGRNGAVAFEVWNEPVKGPNDWQANAEDWRALSRYWERLISIIRRHSDNLIILAGGSWAYSLKGIRELPPADANVAFSWHVYASKESNDELRWAAAFDNLSNDYPVIVSEWGFDEQGAPHFKGGVADFGAKFATNWLEGRNLHWVAWCWHNEIGPAMLQRDWATPTPFGGFVKALLRLNPHAEPPAPRFLFVPAALPSSARPDFLK